MYIPEGPWYVYSMVLVSLQEYTYHGPSKGCPVWRSLSGGMWWAGASSQGTPWKQLVCVVKFSAADVRHGRPWGFVAGSFGGSLSTRDTLGSPNIASFHESHTHQRIGKSWEEQTV